MPLILSGNVASAISGAYEVANSCRFNDGDSAYMHKTPGGAGNRRTFTISVWFKYAPTGTIQAILSTGDYSSDEGYLQINLSTSGRLTIDDYDTSGESYNLRWTTAQPTRFRDPAAWYNLILAVDTTDATEANRVKVYLNGTSITSLFTQTTTPSQNDDFHVNMAQIVQIGRSQNNNNYFDGYLAEFCVVDGSQLAATSFGEFDEDSPTIWKPIDVSGLTFGTNGFYLDFEDSANLGNDKNGGTDLTEVNLAATDQATDTPTNNFATLNPLDNIAANTFSEGNLVQTSITENYGWVPSTFGMTSGKWYAECKQTGFSGSSNYDLIGVASAQLTAADDYLGNIAGTSSYYGQAGVYHGSGSTTSTYDSYTTNDIIGVAIDLDNNKLYYSKNGTWQNSGDPTSGATGTGALALTAVGSTALGAYFFASGEYGTSLVVNNSWNFGSPAFSISSGNADGNGYGNFEYAPPSGYLALCTKNLGSDGG